MYPHIYCSIDKCGSRSMKLAHNRWNKNVINGFYLFSNHNTSNIPDISKLIVNSSLAYQKKIDDTISDPESDHLFLHLLGAYLVYILFHLLCGNYPLTSKRGRCRNLISVDSWLNQIDPNTNIISRQIQNGDIEPNSKYCLKEYFNLA